MMICAARVNVKYLAEKERSSSLEIARAFSPLFALLFIQRAKLRIAKKSVTFKISPKKTAISKFKISTWIFLKIVKTFWKE